MSVIGAQNFWVAGSRFYYKRDDDGSTVFPVLDLGIIEPANPELAIDKVELNDSDGGINTLVDEAVTRIDEVYNITCNNLNMENLALMFLGEFPEDFTQVAEEKDIAHYAHVGRLIKIADDDLDATNLYGLSTVAGVYTGTVQTAPVTDIVKATKTLTITGDVTTDVVPGEAIFVNALGLTDINNSKSYTVVSATFSVTTEVVVQEEPASDETTITGTITFKDAGSVFLPGVDWEVVSLDRGLIRMIESGAFAADAPVNVVFSKGAITGERLFFPHTSAGEIKGECFLVWGRENNAEQTVREARISITPNASTIQVEDYSNIVLAVRVLSDLTNEKSAGRMLAFKGDLPAKS